MSIVCEGESLRLSFHGENFGRLAMNITLTLEGESVEFSYQPMDEVQIESVEP